MDTGKRKRVSFYLEPEDIPMLDRIKQVQFYDKSYAELLRVLVRKGIDVMQKGD